MDLSRSGFRAHRISVLVLVSALAVGGCGGSSPKIPGPDVVGMSLLHAEHVLLQHHLGFVEELQGGLLTRAPNGDTIRTGWIVCNENYQNATMVGLTTKKQSR